MILGSLRAEDFLRRHWQKKPLFLPGVFPDAASLITPDELAGLALEEELESRLVFEKRGKRRWTLERGPFEEEALRGLPRSGWSLLVQGLERVLPEFAELLPLFSFLPGWRLDDLMVSLAPDGGSVGPHLDRYDVFLVQLSGERRWDISDEPLEDDFLQGVDLRILKSFRPAKTYVARPGDILYLPPRFGHHGVAQGMAMTLSVGFRAPRVQDLLHALADTLSEADVFYEDPDLSPSKTPGLIDDEALARVADLMKNVAQDKRALASAWGRLVTMPRRGHAERIVRCSVAKVDEALRQGKSLVPALGLRLAFRGTSLFVEGEEWDVSGITPALLTRLGTMKVIVARDLRALVRKNADRELCARLCSKRAFRFQR